MINYNFHRQQPFYNREGDGGAGIFMLDRFFFMSVENNFFFRHQTFFLYIHEAKKMFKDFFFTQDLQADIYQQMLKLYKKR
jgi:hypothetical protein